MIISERLSGGIIALLSLYIVGLVGTIYGLAPEVCAKRALIGASIGYFGGRLAARCINAILTSAMIDHMARQQQEKERVNKG